VSELKVPESSYSHAIEVPIDANCCEYTNRVTALPTPEFLVFLGKHAIPFERTAAPGRQRSQWAGDAPVHRKHRAARPPSDLRRPLPDAVELGPEARVLLTSSPPGS
jgi:hypothetical protein